MPSATYEQLLIETMPSRIEDDDRYVALLKRLGDLTGNTQRTAAEEKLYRLLQILVGDYDRRNAEPPEGISPPEMLQYLVDESGKSAGELLAPVFGSRSHVSEALSGKRPISATQAQKLGRMFHVKPGLFIQSIV